MKRANLILSHVAWVVQIGLFLELFDNAKTDSGHNATFKDANYKIIVLGCTDFTIVIYLKGPYRMGKKVF